MSAYVVSERHINALVNFAASNDPHVSYRDAAGVWHTFHAGVDAQKIADILYAENVRSVCARYADDKPENYPPIRHRLNVPGVKMLSPVAILKLADCLDYQSCETDDWRDTIAYQILEHIKDKAIQALPGYDTSPWDT